MATDRLIKEISQQLKKTILFLEKLTKLGKLKSDRDALVKDLKFLEERCSRSTAGGYDAGGAMETYDDVQGVDGKQQSEVYDDVGQQAGQTYDDCNSVLPESMEDGGAVYDDTDVTNQNYDDVSGVAAGAATGPPAVIYDVECEKLFHPTKQGFMDQKKDGFNFLKSAWQKRWCVLHRGILYLYDSAKDKKQKEAFRINGYKYKRREDLTKEAKRKDRCFELRGKDKVFEFCTPDKESMRQWCDLFGGSRQPSIASDEKSYNDVEAPKAAGDLYDDNVIAPGEVYEDTGAINYDDTSVAPTVSDGDGDLYEVSDSAPPAMKPPPPRIPPSAPQARRPSARDELPLPPPMNRPAIPIPTAGPPLPSRDDGGRAPMPPPLPPTSGPPLPSRDDVGRAPMPPPLPPTPSPQRQFPLPPSVEPMPPSPNLPPLPPMEDLDPALDDNLDAFGESKDDYVNMYQGMWDCYPDEDNELMFKRGEIIHILSRDYDNYGWWIAENRLEEIGLVPTSYIMKAYDC